MKFKIGKRYRWSPYNLGEEKWKNGILSEVLTDTNNEVCGIFITRDNEKWEIPLDDIYLDEYKEKED